MRTKIDVRCSFILMVGLVTSVSTYATDFSDSVCQNDTTYEQHQCLEKQQTNADQALRDTYKALHMLAKRIGDEWATELQQAQDKWLAFRDANCAFYGGYLSGGTGAAVIASRCRVQMTKEREAELMKEFKYLVSREGT